jgi:hypothetical protein
MDDALTSETLSAATLLDRAEQALKSGHFAAARGLLRQVAEDKQASVDEVLVARLATLRERLSPDPLIPILILLCLFLYGAIIVSTVN